MGAVRLRFVAVLWLILLFISVGLIIFFFATSPASASILPVFGPTPMPTQENLWAFADLPKPTHTPVPVTPTIVPTDTALAPAPTETPAAWSWKS